MVSVLRANSPFAEFVAMILFILILGFMVTGKHMMVTQCHTSWNLKNHITTWNIIQTWTFGNLGIFPHGMCIHVNPLTDFNERHLT